MDSSQYNQVYLDTVNRLEPEIAMIDTGAGLASIAISLKRIADILEEILIIVKDDTTENSTPR